MQNFSFYLYNANLIMRLEARADGIGNALMSSDSNVTLSEAFSGKFYVKIEKINLFVNIFIFIFK